jgi:hypothetical protein
MNKKLKILISVLGGINNIFSIFIPTLISLLIITSIELNNINQIILIGAGLLSTLFRAMNNIIPILDK